MKKILITFLLATLLLSCSNSNDKENKDKIIGTWEFVSSTADVVETADEEITGQIKGEISSDENKRHAYYMQFDKNGKGITFENLGEPGYNERTEFTYTISDEELIMKSAFDTAKYTIVHLKGKKLVVMYDETNYFQEMFPNVEIVKVVSVVHYKKIK